MSGFRPDTKHPLMGARLRVLLGAAMRYGGVAPRNLPLYSLMVLSALGRLPFGLLERAIAAGRIARAPDMEDPVFVIGHWRSGTTHLQNVMARSPAFGHISPLASGLPDQILTLGAWLRPLLEKALPEDRKIDRVAVTPQSPQEDEIPLASRQTLSVFHALYFPKHFQNRVDEGVFFEGVSEAAIARWARHARAFAEKIAVEQGVPRILIKNPVYTARIARLLDIWPRARFVHIRRNPYEVFVSTRNYYRKLLPSLALQGFGHVDIEPFVLDTFSRLMARYREERELLGEGALAEVTYERLIREPVPVLAEIHERLGLPGWDAARPRAEAYLKSIGGYRTNKYEITDADRRAVDTHWADELAVWEGMAH